MFSETVSVLYGRAVKPFEYSPNFLSLSNQLLNRRLIFALSVSSVPLCEN